MDGTEGGFPYKTDGGSGLFDGRLTSEDFADAPGRPSWDRRSQDAAPQDEASHETRPLYDGRPVRDPYDRGGGYRRASDEAWAAARDDYLAGETAETVSARYGMAISTFRQRARDKGWRRVDQVDPPYDPLDLNEAAADGPADYGRMADMALMRLNRAVEAGRAIEAARWMRLHLSLTALARDGSPPPPPPAPKAPPPKDAKEPDLAARAEALAQEICVIAQAAAALTPGDYAGRDALMARIDALDDLEPAVISDRIDNSDGVFSEGQSETGPP
ncbi:MAG: hypothetical protein Q7J26_10960 [Brevundimonas sp.]|uniref:hypothetical protein n=1 Tax=Brevundimonas sp. TaxID=1871086 RepID=UPI00271F3781|nr:hypothetical protein [Brevundimonas sp.]MDO9609034.1 hypothetical protein [Brevundimonas sp.]